MAWEAVDLLDRAAVRAAIARLRPSAVYHCAGAAHVGRSWANSEPTFAINVRGTHHLLDALARRGHRRARPRAELGDGLRQLGRSARRGSSAHAGEPYALSKLAQEMLAQHDTGGLEVMVARAFNHFGPRQDPWFVASGFARRIADIEAGALGAGDRRRQPRRPARPDRRPRHGPRLPADPRARPPRPRLQRLLGPRHRHSRPARPAARARARADRGPRRPGALSPQRRAARRRRSRADPRRARMGGGDSPRADARRSPRLLARAMRVLVTGGTGYLGRAVVGALAARGHDLVVFARQASRSGLPGRASTATSATRARSSAPPRDATRSATWRRSSASGAARRGLRRGERRRPRQRDRRRPPHRIPRLALHLVVSRAAADRAAPRRSTRTITSGRRSRPIASPIAPSATARRSPASIPASSTVRAR